MELVSAIVETYVGLCFTIVQLAEEIIFVGRFSISEGSYKVSETVSAEEIVEAARDLPLGNSKIYEIAARVARFNSLRTRVHE